MSPLESAILQLQEDMDSYGQGTAKQPAEGTTDWFKLRAVTVGLSYLKRIQTLELSSNAAACDRIYQYVNRGYKNAMPELMPVAEKPE